MPATLVTQLGLAKLSIASGQETGVPIAFIGLGDGGGAAYDPVDSATALRRERIRVAIEKRHIIEEKTWRVVATVPPEAVAFYVREMGFYDKDGNLICIWAGADVQPRQTGAATYLIDHILNFSRIKKGLIYVAAPDDELFDFSLVMLAEQASQRLHMFQMNERILTT